MADDERQTGVWSRTRIREENGLPSPWRFDGLSVGLIGYRTPTGSCLLIGAPAFCEWLRRRRDG